MLRKTPKPKFLILHADDMGLAHSVNMATFSAFQHGHISSASIMVPCPAFAEAAEFARANRDADIGVHLTLTSEWTSYRWGPVAPRDRVPTLLDEHGYFWNGPEHVAKRADAREVYLEMHAQIDRALHEGVIPTHLDSHMFALFETPDLVSVLACVAKEYGLPFLLSRNMPLRKTTIRKLGRNNPLLDSLLFLGQSIPSQDAKQWYVRAVSGFSRGVTQLIVHLGYDDPELAARIGHDVSFGAAWRQDDFDAITSTDFKEALRRANIHLVTWEQVKRSEFE